MIGLHGWVTVRDAYRDAKQGRGKGGGRYGVRCF